MGIFHSRLTSTTVTEQGGTYTLVMDVPRQLRLEIGALGEVDLPAGGYTYTGSAHGSGGFARVDRHHDLADGKRQVRHWHIDYCLGHPAVSIVDTVRIPGRDVECSVARQLGTGPVAGFGASDCDCQAHLARFETPSAAVTAVRGLYASLFGTEV